MNGDPRAATRMCAALVDALAGSGVRHLCFAPGSRSAPLAVAFDRHPHVRVWMHLDERSAAYFGLGLARAERAPVALLATSGSAAANFLPAIVEAGRSRVPLVVLTADRPPELRDAGANQTIDQSGLYGSVVRWAHELAIAEDRDAFEGYARTVAQRAVAAAVTSPAGPVHLNVPLREPLLPEPDALPPVEVGTRVPLAVSPRPPAADAVKEVARILAAAARGLIVCGPQDDPRLPASLARLARVTGSPVLADALSLARTGPHDRVSIVGRYDAFLRDDALAAMLAPDVVVRVGDTPTSKTLLERLAGWDAARQILVPGEGRWNDPTFTARDVLLGDAAATSDALADAIPAANGPGSWADLWTRIDRRAGEALDAWRAQLREPFEGDAVARLAECLPDGSTLVAGNSMPVRDADAFVAPSARSIRIMANRGHSGIDGVLSTALGVAAAGRGPVALAVGDVSFVHDLGGLVAARLHDLRATVLLLNNDGGGIFSFLPAARHRERFERLFGTPHGLDLSHARELFGIGFTRIEDPNDLGRALDEALGADGVNVVEVRTDRERNVALHRAAWRAVSEATAPVTA